MKRELWLNEKFDKPCPNCTTGRLIYNSKQAICNETKTSLENNERNKNDFGWPTSNYLITAHLKCDECSEVVTATYDKTDDVRWTDDDGNEISLWEPVLYHPAPHIIHIPKSCDDAVKKHLFKSFGLFWYDTASCANKIRVALEALLEKLGISSKSTTGTFISLGRRLAALAKAKPSVQPFLDGVRLIGNMGSHDDVLTKEDLLDAYELIEYALELIYNERETILLSLSKNIIANKGPIKR